MARLTPRFSTSRTVCEYTEKYYIPAATAYRRRAADNGAVGASVVRWERALREKWPGVRFGEPKVETYGAQHHFEVEVALAGFDPDAVRVELYADGRAGEPPERQEMAQTLRLTGTPSRYLYSAAVPDVRPPSDYTARAFPHREGVSVPLEVDCITWQR